MRTEEDGVDESGRIMAPPGLEPDPDGEAADPIVDNGTMSSSRSRFGSSRSGTVRRASSENAASPGKAETPATEPPEEAAGAATDATATGSDKTVPLPADPADVSSRDAPVDNSAAKDNAKPSFASPWPAPPAIPVADSTTRSEPYLSAPYADTGSYAGAASHQGPGATPPGSPYVPPSSYPRPGWTNPERRADQAPPLAPPRPPSGNGYISSNGLPPAAPPAAGATAGLAGSVTSGWQVGAPAPADSNRKWQGARGRKASKRQAMLTLARVEPWSVMKFSFVASVAAFIILFVAVALLYMVLAALGVFDSIQNTVSSVTSSQGSSGTNIAHWFSPSLILGYTAMLGAFNIVIITALSTVGSVIYNLIAKLFGGIEVTLRETD